MAVDAGTVITTEVMWSNNRGRTWTPVQVVSGTVTADRTSQTRWAMDINVDPRTVIDLDGVNPYTTRVRIRRGVKPLRGDPVWSPLGLYRVSKTVQKTDGTVNLVGESFEAAVKDARLLTPRTIGGGNVDTAQSVIEHLVTEAVPDAGFDWRVTGAFTIPTTQQDTERWGFIDGTTDSGSIAKALGAEVYCDGEGAFVVAPVPSVLDNPVSRIARGDALVSNETDLDRTGTYNVVVANGQSTDGATPPVGPGIAWDNDPNSPTYAGPDPVNHPELAGPFGVVPRFYVSPLLTTLIQCQMAAQSLLVNDLGLNKVVTFDSVIDPQRVPGEVVAVETQAGGFENHLIDTIRFDLASAVMTVNTRANTTRLIGLGQAVADPNAGDVTVST